MTKEKQTIADILDLIDRNRSGTEFINLCEYELIDAYSVFRTDSIALDMISDREVDSMGVIDGRMIIYLADETIKDYWESNKKAAQEVAAKKHEPTAREIVDGVRED